MGVLVGIDCQTVSGALCESLNGPNGNNRAEQQYCQPCYATEGSFDYRYYVLALLALLPTPASEHPACLPMQRWDNAFNWSRFCFQ